MVRTVIRLDENDKQWLDAWAREKHLPMAEGVRQAAHRLREASARDVQGMDDASLTLLLDSVIFIDHFNGVVKATDYLSKWRKLAVISVITPAEVLTGFAAHGEHLAIKLLVAFPTLVTDTPVADLAA